MTTARNKHPLHYHTPAEEAEHPWTTDTLDPHLRVMHGVDGLPEGETLASLAAIHGALNHGEPAAREGAPAVRADDQTVEWLARQAYEAHTRSLVGTGTRVSVVPPWKHLASRHRAAWREAVAAVWPPESDAINKLAAAAARWVERVAADPRGRAAAEVEVGEAVHRAHVIGYGLGVGDMVATGNDLDSALDVLEDGAERISDEQAGRLSVLLAKRLTGS